MKKVLLLIILICLISCSRKSIEQDNSTKNAYHKKGEKFRDSKVLDSAFYYYSLAKEKYIKNNDSTKAAESLINMAIIQTTKGDFYGSIETSLEANKLLVDEKDTTVKKDLAISYNNMGIASGFLYNYNDAIQFYKKAAQFTSNKENALLCYNNIAVAYLLKKDTRLAKKYLNYAIQAKSKGNYARALNNLGKLKLLENPNYNPLPEFYKALEIRLNSNDTEGLNSSYSTLSDYFKDRDNNKSLLFAKKMLETAAIVKNPEDQMQALQKLIELDHPNYLKYFKKFQSLNDSLIISRGKAKNQFALIRFDVEKQKLENEQLKGRDFKKNIGIAALVLLLFGSLFWYTKRKKRLEQEKEIEVKNTQLKMSKKVHDVVANGIYQVMTKIENQEHFNKDEALDELEFVYEKSRDISYEKTDTQGEEKDFSEKISETVSSFKNDEVNTYLAGNDIGIWKHLSTKNKEEVYQIIRELLVNMKKHSKATIVSFRFERENDLIRIFYTDNGIGISGDVIYKNGLSSTVSRIETINGEIIFDTKIEKGLKITISFPAS
ncbi:hypothetical protein MKS83_15205 [Chryseobacterium sp. Y16C]|uniref:tetratricopeptide repeat-containing sensor histidine kinase n=1 Tax=Chryseobacterium sp. Y16C TaxID=2920939 RepID=UPI001F0AFC6B|nr:hypothetical protein [Chryseobacterium sp. Y16C]UMQ40740.1 hypothetical protein MKS83_15205 [Chryseobacterium sp. Y16C]